MRASDAYTHQHTAQNRGMEKINWADLHTQAESMGPEERDQLAEKLRQELELEDRPRNSILDFMGVMPWDGRDIDERIRLLREEWDERAERLGY